MMGLRRYVQHISGQGEKWELHENQFTQLGEYRVLSKTCPHGIHAVPMSEFKPCDPPEEWEELPHNKRVGLDGENFFVSDGELFYAGRKIVLAKGFRFAERGQTLVIERRKS